MITVIILPSDYFSLHLITYIYNLIFLTMKRVLQLFLITLVITFVSCKKEEQVLQKEVGKEISDSKIQNDGKFKKEIIVTDESGVNQAFFAIYSDDEQLLSEYLESTRFSLKINENEKLKSTDLSKQNILDSDNTDNYDLTQEPKIIVELVTANLQDNVTNYSLEVNSVKTKSTRDWITGYPVGYTTSNDFIGAVHKGWGHKFIAKLRYRTHWYSSWQYLTVNGANAWFIYPFGQYYICLDEDYSFYKRGIIIYPHLYQNGINYTISYNSDDYRGHYCTILGSYDGANCYVGTPPSGTTAFIYANNFYYTPVSGNQCPRPGSWFDGSNCFVMDIPNSCSPFIWSNKWYVRSDLIPH